MNILNPSSLEQAKAPGLISSPTSVETTVSEAPVVKGRWKEPPSCSDPSLKATAMTQEQLAELAYNLKAENSVVYFTSHGALSEETVPVPGEAVPVSSSSSTCTRESDALSDFDSSKPDSVFKTAMSPVRSSVPLNFNKTVGDDLNIKQSTRKTSRQGRETQRWDHDTSTNERIRLVTGCVPILRDGSILFVSSSRKSEWILPKGGWEMDEDMEESAIRETHEEAGVLGVLGPKLSAFQYETRKAKKRRMEMEELNQKKFKHAPSDLIPSAESLSKDEQTVASGRYSETPSKSEALIHIIAQGKAGSSKQPEDSSSASSSYTQVRMNLFPLYVLRVCDSWPESGRLRKVVKIEEAIKMMESRPEFKAALIEVRDRGLHLVKNPLDSASEQ